MWIIHTIVKGSKQTHGKVPGQVRIHKPWLIVWQAKWCQTNERKIDEVDDGPNDDCRPANSWAVRRIINNSIDTLRWRIFVCVCSWCMYYSERNTQLHPMKPHEKYTSTYAILRSKQSNGSESIYVKQQVYCVYMNSQNTNGRVMSRHRVHLILCQQRWWF